MARPVTEGLAAIVLLMPVLALGCLGDAPLENRFHRMPEHALVEPYVAKYAHVDAKKADPAASILWQKLNGTYTFFTAHGHRVETEAITFTARVGDETAMIATFLREKDGTADLGVILDCTPPFEACQHADIEWGAPEGPLSLFGAAALKAFNASDFEKDVIEIRAGAANSSIRVTKGEGSTYTLEPLSRESRFAGFCNILDDVTVVDPTQSVILECRPQDDPGSSFMLLDLETVPSSGTVRAEGAKRPLVDLARPAGPLPPGSEIPSPPHNFTLHDAHTKAVELSEPLRQLLEKHPEAAFEYAALTQKTWSSLADDAVSEESLVYTLRYVVKDGRLFELRVDRNTTSIMGNPLEPIYSVFGEREEEAPPMHRWPDMQPLAPMASIQDMVDLLPLPPGWYVEHLAIFNDAEEFENRARYAYFVTMVHNGCQGQAQPCRDTITWVGASDEGRFVRAAIPHDILTRFVERADT